MLLLETLRRRTQQKEQDLTLALLQTPLRDREGVILQWIQYRDHKNVPGDRAGDACSANRIETLTREEISALMFRADTLEQCAEAWKARAAYLCEHPDDTGIIKEGEALWMTEQAIKNMEAQQQSEQETAAFQVDLKP